MVVMRFTWPPGPSQRTGAPPFRQPQWRYRWWHDVVTLGLLMLDRLLFLPLKAIRSLLRPEHPESPPPGRAPRVRSLLVGAMKDEL